MGRIIYVAGMVLLVAALVFGAINGIIFAAQFSPYAVHTSARLGEQLGQYIDPGYVPPTPRPAPTTAPARFDDQSVRAIATATPQVFVLPYGGQSVQVVVTATPAPSQVKQVAGKPCVTLSDLQRVMQVQTPLRGGNNRVAGGQGTLLTDLSVQNAPWIAAIDKDGGRVQRAGAGSFVSVWIRPELECPDP